MKEVKEGIKNETIKSHEGENDKNSHQEDVDLDDLL